MNIKHTIINSISAFLELNFSTEKSIVSKLIQVENTNESFDGDFTVVVFPFLKFTKKSPEETAKIIGNHLVQSIIEIESFHTIKGFLNLTLKDSFWQNFLNETFANEQLLNDENPSNQTIMVEFSSPNTNKPLHLGHIRNNLLGNAIAEILKANGNKVIKANLVNDRGIHTCKSMLAWKLFGNGITPEQSDKKGDHLVGDFYVLFDKEYRKQVEQLINEGHEKTFAENNAPILLQAREMLQKWEAGEKETVELWKMLNNWVYKGFDETYRNLGIEFDITDYESETYNLGKTIVNENLNSGKFYKKEDGTICVNLTNVGLDEKVLLRSDGTSVYITQDIGTAVQRFTNYNLDKLIYVVGNEQNYHFQVLTEIIRKIGYQYFSNLFHLSYGMVELPSGKMKSREGKVVDADDLMSEMYETSERISRELKKIESVNSAENEKLLRIISLGALKYFILKVDPVKNMMFIPEESIDFDGNTGTFIQYSFARIQSLKRKSEELKITIDKKIDYEYLINKKERKILKIIYNFREIVAEAGNKLNPALIANFSYELAKEFNQFYHDFQILKENESARNFRLKLSISTGNVLQKAFQLLGIEMPEKM